MARKREKKYALKRKVIRVGDSCGITIPSFVLEQKELRIGSTVRLLFNGIPGILIQKAEVTEQKKR
jgi:antitoxin component of MazEF toxin-antitoxin module